MTERKPKAPADGSTTSTEALAAVKDPDAILESKPKPRPFEEAAAEGEAGPARLDADGRIVFGLDQG